MKAWQPIVRFAIGIIAALGLGALIVNTLVTGRDVPGGLLSLMLAVIGAVYGADALERKKGRDESDS